MEHIWYIIAALGAGIGTGLAGLSAATVMVPILIELCPSFSGYVVFLVGNVVLGSFALFLTCCIGIRFLVKPDTSRTDGAANGCMLWHLH